MLLRLRKIERQSMSDALHVIIPGPLVVEEDTFGKLQVMLGSAIATWTMHWWLKAGDTSGQ